MVAVYGGSYDLLLGRRTYAIWSGFWPAAPSGPLADGINAATKYIATNRPESLNWGPAKALGPDIVERVRRLKATEGPDLILAGSSTLTSLLLPQGLADELMLIVYPVLPGTGKRLLSQGSEACALTLTKSQALPSGVVINTYRSDRPFRFG